MVWLGKRVGFRPSLLALATLALTLTVSCGRVFNDGSNVADSRASNLTDGSQAVSAPEAQGEKTTIKVSISASADGASAGLNLAASMFPQLKSSVWHLQGCAVQHAHESILGTLGQGETAAPDNGGEISGGIEVSVNVKDEDGCVLSVESFQASINGELITYVFDPYIVGDATIAGTRANFFGEGKAAPAAALEAQYYASPSRNDNLNAVTMRRVGAGLDPKVSSAPGEQKYVVILVDKGASIIAKGPSDQALGKIGLIAVPVSLLELRLAKGKKNVNAQIELTFSCLLPLAQQSLCEGVLAWFIPSAQVAGSGASLSKKDLVDKCTGSGTALTKGFSGFSDPQKVDLKTVAGANIVNGSIDSSKEHYLILKYQSTTGDAWKYYPVAFGSKRDFDGEDHSD